MLRVESIEVGYTERPVLKDLSLHVEEGSIAAVLGANGAGKTTLLRTIMGLLHPGRGGFSSRERRSRIYLRTRLSSGASP